MDSDGYMWESEEEFLAEMDREGCIREFSWDENGELMMAWHMDVLKEKYPDVHAVVQEGLLEQVDEALSGLVDKGLLDISFQETEDGRLEALYSLTEEGERMAKALGDEFDTTLFPPENL